MTHTSPVEASERFHAMFARHYRAVYAYAARRIGAEDAADVANDVFTVAWRKLATTPTEPDTLPWLYGVARRTLANHHRYRRRQARLRSKALSMAERPAQSDPSDAIAVRAALSALSPADQEVLALSAWEGLEPRHIAAALGCSTNAASVRLHRARQRLAKQLENGDSR